MLTHHPLVASFWSIDLFVSCRRTQVCLSLQLLLQTPEPNDGLDPEIAAHWKNSRKEAEATALRWNEIYAIRK